MKYVHEDIYIFRREIVVIRDNCKYLSNLWNISRNKYYLQMTKCKLVEGYLNPWRYLFIFRREIVVIRDNCKYLSNLWNISRNKYYLQMTKCKLVEGYLNPWRYLFIFHREIVMVTKNNCKYLSNLWNIEIYQEISNKYYLQMTNDDVI